MSTHVLDNALVTGNAIIANDATAAGRALVTGNAVLCGNAFITDLVLVQGNAVVAGNAAIFGHSIVQGDATITGWARIYYAYLDYDAYVFEPWHVQTFTTRENRLVTVFRATNSEGWNATGPLADVPQEILDKFIATVTSD